MRFGDLLLALLVIILFLGIVKWFLRSVIHKPELANLF